MICILSSALLGSFSAWLGLSDWPENLHFNSWDGGTSVSYTNWASGELEQGGSGKREQTAGRGANSTEREEVGMMENFKFNIWGRGRCVS